VRGIELRSVTERMVHIWTWCVISKTLSFTALRHVQGVDVIVISLVAIPPIVAIHGSGMRPRSPVNVRECARGKIDNPS
jgi:hypothetical protein